VNDPIGVVCGSWPPMKCGIGDFAQRLSLELARGGHAVVAVTRRGACVDAPSGPAVSGGDARVGPTSGLAVEAVVPGWRPWHLPRVLATLRRHAVRVVNLHYPTQRYGRFSAVDLIPRAVRFGLGVPVVTSVHEYSSFHAAGRARVRALVRGSSAAIVPDARNLEALSMDLGGRARLHHVPLAPVLEPALPPGYERESFRTSAGARSSTFVLAYLGLISPGKGVGTLLDAFERLPAALDAVLWVLADREPSEPAYEAAHRAVAPRLLALEARGRVRWTGYLEPAEMSRHLAAADLAVLPFDDGASLRRTTLIAALAHGLPVLSCGATAPAGGIEVVPAADSEALAASIARLAADPARRAALAGAARVAGAAFSWREVAAGTARVLESVAR